MRDIAIMSLEELEAIAARSIEGRSGDIQKLVSEVRRLRSLIWTPHTDDFLTAVRVEAAHQRDRWGENHDQDKSDQDWFWLLGYLAGKAIRPEQTQEKRLHHIITTAATCLNWHRLAKEKNAS